MMRRFVNDYQVLVNAYALYKLAPIVRCCLLSHTVRGTTKPHASIGWDEVKGARELELWVCRDSKAPIYALNIESMIYAPTALLMEN